MRAAFLAGLALLQVTAQYAAYEPAQHLRMQREVDVPAGRSGQACAVLDADVYAHAESESLNDVRLFAKATGAETPFTLTESNTARLESEPATVRNLGTEGEAIVFDLEMPKRAYTAVELKLDGRDFVGSAEVSGRSADGAAVALGAFPLFDLSSRRLSRSTMLPLQESTFAELHVRLRLQAAPGSAARRFSSAVVAGAEVPPSREAQTLYTNVAATNAWVQRGHDSVATLRLPAHVPVARVQVVLDPGYRANFLREVTVSAKPDHDESADPAASEVETVSGQISQVHLAGVSAEQSGIGAAEMSIADRQLSMDAVLATNLRGPATVEIAVANENDAPLPLRSVQLEMRERRICFDTSLQGGGYLLMYGDKDLAAPVYDYSRLFVASVSPVQATLGPEHANPNFVPRADARPFTERHPDLLWLGLLAALAALGGVAMRGVRHRRGASH